MGFPQLGSMDERSMKRHAGITLMVQPQEHFMPSESKNVGYSGHSRRALPYQTWLRNEYEQKECAAAQEVFLSQGLQVFAHAPD